MKEFKKIYLQPECCVKDQEVGRMWCQDAINDCEEGNAWTEYLLASDVNKRIAELELHLKQTLDNAMSQASDLRDHIAELEQERKDLIEEFAEAECMGDLAKIARNYGYEAKSLKEQDNG
jgi:hypothetical protein